MPRMLLLLLALLPIAAGLIAAGPSPGPCGRTPASDPSAADRGQPAQTDLSGRPLPATPLLNSALVVGPSPEAVEACGEVQRRSDQLPDARSDALHGLPPSDLMQVVPSQPGH
jgi:hypothetical protein